MSNTAQQPLQAAMQLPEEDRAELTAQLLESFAPLPGDEDSAQISAEIERRIAELEGAVVTPVSWEEVRKRLQEGL
jgi:putative addiction module component (TIGR02574 family)